MDFKFNHFVIFATSISLLILVSLFYNNVFSYLKKEYGTTDVSFDFKPFDLRDSGGGQEVRSNVPVGTDNAAIEKPSRDGRPQNDAPTSQDAPTSEDAPTRDDAPASEDPPEKDEKGDVESDNTYRTGRTKGFWNTTLEMPSFLTSRSSRETTNVGYTSTPTPTLFSTSPVTTLISTTMSRLTTPPSLATTLRESSTLGKVKVTENIYAEDTVIVLDSTKTPLTKGMRLLINDDVYTIMDVKTNSSWFTSALKVTLDRPTTENVEKGAMLKIVTPQSSSAPVTTISPNFFNTSSIV
jgi:hypothetical protein